MRGQPGFFDFDDRLKQLSDPGDQLESFRSAVDFELFRPELNAALSYADRTEGGRPPFRNTVLQPQPQEPHKRQPVIDEKFGPFIGKIVSALDDQDLEHQHWVAGSS